MYRQDDRQQDDDDNMCSTSLQGNQEAEYLEEYLEDDSDLGSDAEMEMQ